jgi:hypothetical protein
LADAITGGDDTDEAEISGGGTSAVADISMSAFDVAAVSIDGAGKP